MTHHLQAPPAPLGAAKCLCFSFSAVLFLEKRNRAFRGVPEVLLLSGAVWEGTAPWMPASSQPKGEWPSCSLARHLPWPTFVQTCVFFLHLQSVL